MKAGQRPTPTALKLLRGNPGKQRLPANEPQPDQTIEVPDPPPFISGYAADEWWTVGTELSGRSEWPYAHQPRCQGVIVKKGADDRPPVA
jgi:hypothetical protein